MKYVYIIFVLIISLTLYASQVKAADMVIYNGSKVAFDYTLTVDGKVMDTSEGKGPLEYTQGDDSLIPGLTKQMAGLKAGDERTIEVKPEEAYGNTDPAAFREFPLSTLPAGTKPAVGMTLQAQDQYGDLVTVRIAEIKKDSIIVDFNHPLAGKILIFKIKVISVK